MCLIKNPLFHGYATIINKAESLPCLNPQSNEFPGKKKPVISTTEQMCCWSLVSSETPAALIWLTKKEQALFAEYYIAAQEIKTKPIPGSRLGVVLLL